MKGILAIMLSHHIISGSGFDDKSHCDSGSGIDDKIIMEVDVGLMKMMVR